MVFHRKTFCIAAFLCTFQWPSQERHDVLNHRQIGCVYSLLFFKSNNTENFKAPHYWPFVKGMHWSPVDSSREIMRKAFLVMTSSCLYGDSAGADSLHNGAAKQNPRIFSVARASEIIWSIITDQTANKPMKITTLQLIKQTCNEPPSVANDHMHTGGFNMMMSFHGYTIHITDPLWVDNLLVKQLRHMQGSMA